MASDELKSAYELAMERLRAKEKEEGIEEQHPLTNEQKQAIAALREEGRAKLAELEILHKKNRAAALADPAKLAEVEEHYGIDRRRAEEAMEAKIARIRRGESPKEG
jgi:hypothetical protein